MTDDLYLIEDQAEARERVKKWWDDPKHKGKPEDDARTKDDRLDDPTKQKGDE